MKPVRLIELSTPDGLQRAPYQDIRRGTWPYWTQCENRTWRWGAHIARDGSPRIHRACNKCDKPIDANGSHTYSGGTVSLDLIATDIAKVVVLKDNRNGTTVDTPTSPCEHCGSTLGAQLHHWAPCHLFPDPEDWPTAWLCRTCHTKWHQTIRNHR